MNEDVLASGGAFIPENEVYKDEMSEEEKKMLETAQRESIELRVLANSPAWNRVKEKFIEKITNLKYDVVKMNENQGSLNEIGQQFKIYEICEKELLSLINEVDQSTLVGGNSNE